MSALPRGPRIDPYIVAIVGLVVIAATLPARGADINVLGQVVHAAIALLVFIYGAKILPQAIWARILP